MKFIILFNVLMWRVYDSPPHSSFWFLITIADEPHMEILQSIDSGLESNLQVMGLKRIHSNLNFYSSSGGRHTLSVGIHLPSNKEVMQTYSITDPVYSPFENTSDRLKRVLPEVRFAIMMKSSFYRIQAIDAIKNELVWSVKIYPLKTKGLRTESIPQVIKDLTRSFSQGQFKYSKIRK